jgi:hypothetical protein
MEIDDSKSQYQPRRPATNIGGRKERYFDDDDASELMMEGSLFDGATEMTREQRNQGAMRYEENEPTEYYGSEYYDSEEEREMEEQQ